MKFGTLPSAREGTLRFDCGWARSNAHRRTRNRPTGLLHDVQVDRSAGRILRGDLHHHRLEPLALDEFLQGTTGLLHVARPAPWPKVGIDRFLHLTPGKAMIAPDPVLPDEKRTDERGSPGRWLFHRADSAATLRKRRRCQASRHAVRVDRNTLPPGGWARSAIRTAERGRRHDKGGALWQRPFLSRRPWNAQLARGYVFVTKAVESPSKRHKTWRAFPLCLLETRTRDGRPSSLWSGSVG